MTLQNTGEIIVLPLGASFCYLHRHAEIFSCSWNFTHFAVSDSEFTGRSVENSSAKAARNFLSHPVRQVQHQGNPLNTVREC